LSLSRGLETSWFVNKAFLGSKKYINKSFRPTRGQYSIFFKVKLSLEKNMNMSVTKHPYEPDWQIPLGVRAIGL